MRQQFTRQRILLLVFLCISSTGQVFAQESVVPVETITIQEARKLPKDSVATVTGIVTSLQHELGTGVMYVQDESGGIKAVLKFTDTLAVKRGEEIQVAGTLGAAFSEQYIRVDDPADISVLTEEDAEIVLPAAYPIETQSVSEIYEGQLVGLSGNVTQTSGDTFYVDDGTGEAKIYIKSSAGIDKPPMRKGYYSAIVGIVSQYNDAYRVMPRIQDDVLVAPTLEELGMVLSGEPPILPPTGTADVVQFVFLPMLVSIGGIVLRVVYSLEFAMLE